MTALANQATLFPIRRYPSREVQRVTCHTGDPEYYKPPEMIGRPGVSWVGYP